jgi:3-deoxy-D-manno-octulosonate 8-phosphate phosphatase (KDO 8-P phosphatase)
MNELAPSLNFPPELLLKAQGSHLGMRAAIFDVDGVLTDGTLYVGESGEIFKGFNVLDGHGLKSLLQVGIVPIVITGRDSPAVRRRLADLGLPHGAFGVSDKLAVATPMLESLGLQWPDVAVIGDDWPDIPLLSRAGLSAAPPNAHAEVRARVDYVTQARGGQGAAREFCDLLLMASGHYAQLWRGQRHTLDGR